ncbi:baculoviral IAP repeat-containing protein 7-B-like [Pecten maximus]|uniref:baculoviral IAP repeat-containing protein 7-B-like n=1 Tax=Pecten maximus TaxID=6579 RepID=UPI00145805EB|nr:baculoviral IAP repeat-containing protein 7-B-like [Pecten maximus]XP_033742578.1 baculoviral IAP repeat-containing protein 7-B-like [Pecten maximus]
MDIAPPPPSERYKHLRDPELRKRSFGKWRYYTESFLTELVDEGLFSIDEEKRKVQCVYCGGVLCGIEEGQNVHITHYRHFPKCERFKYREPEFLKLVSNDESVADGMMGTVDMALNMKKNHPTDDERYFDGRGKDTSHSVYISGDIKYPKHSYYSMFIDRLRTFRNWPAHLTQKPETLARAGFFYAGVDDVCECYCCGGQLDGWEDDDEPVREHDKWFSDICPLYQTRQRRTSAGVG